MTTTRNLAVAAIVRDTLKRKLDQARQLTEHPPVEVGELTEQIESVTETLSQQTSILESLPRDLVLEKSEYKRALKEQQARLSDLFRKAGKKTER